MGIKAEAVLDEIIACLDDDLAIVQLNAIETLRSIKTRSNKAIQGLIIVYKKHIYGRGCTFSCCGGDALYESDIVRACLEILGAIDNTGSFEKIVSELIQLEKEKKITRKDCQELVGGLQSLYPEKGRALQEYLLKNNLKTYLSNNTFFDT
ncbi:MAG: hypothetical protein KKH98_10965 [Spirochaetes bacterium]|nr:hypothetical protein [Spirochaetota bacterium]